MSTGLKFKGKVEKQRVAPLKVLKLDTEGNIEADAPRVCTSLSEEDQRDRLVGNGRQKEEEAKSRGREDGRDAVLAALTHTQVCNVSAAV